MCRPRAGEANQLFSVYIALWRPSALAIIYNVVGRQRNLGLSKKLHVSVGIGTIIPFFHRFLAILPSLYGLGAPRNLYYPDFQYLDYTYTRWGQTLEKTDRGNQEWTIQRHGQHWTQDTELERWTSSHHEPYHMIQGWTHMCSLRINSYCFMQDTSRDIHIVKSSHIVFPGYYRNVSCTLN